MAVVSTPVRPESVTAGDESAARRSAPEPGARPVEPTGPPHSEYLEPALRLPLVSESITRRISPGRYRPVQQHTSQLQAAEPGLQPPPPPPSARLPRAHPCFATHSATPAPDWPPTPPLPSTDLSIGLPKRQVPCRSLPFAVCTKNRFATRTRPADREPCPLAGYRRTRRPIAVVPRFSIHLPLCSAGFTPASSLIRGDPTSPWASNGRSRYLPPYRLRGPKEISLE